MADKQPLLPQNHAPVQYFIERERKPQHRTFALICVGVLFGFVFFHPWHWHRWHHHGRTIIVHPGGDVVDDDMFAPDYNPFDGPVNIDDSWDCETLTFPDDSNTTKLDFKLTTHAEKIKLWNRGAVLGNITFESTGDSDDIEVDLKFEKPEWYDADGGCYSTVKVCPFKTPEGDVHSIGIFVPRHGEHGHHVPPEPAPPKPPKWPRPSTHFINVDIAVKFPKKGGPLKINAFSSGLPGLKHYVGDLDVAFGRLDLVGDVIEVKGASATSLEAVSVYGGIYGNFSASRSLELVASKGGIDVNVDLYSDWEDREPVPPTKFEAVAVEGSLAANVSLLTYKDTPSDQPPSYIVKTTSSNSNTTLNFITQPVGSALRVNTVSKLFSTIVKLAPAFEGLFELSAVYSKPEIVVNDETKDPSGEGKTRVVRTQKKDWLPWFLSGSVEWLKLDEEQEHGGRSQVKITTVKAPATLVLG